MAEPFGFSPDQPLATAAEPTPDLDVLRALGAKLGQTWPAHLIKSALGAAALPGDVYSGATPVVGDDGRTNPEVINRSADLAGLVAGVSTPFAEPGAAGIFGGRLAKTADTGKLERAESMTAQGATPSMVHDATGWFQGADGKWRFEIPDNTSQMRNVGAGKMGDAFEHDPLYAAYPDLKEIKTNWGQDRGNGFYNSGTPELNSPETIGLSVGSGLGPDGTIRSVALHELQHAVQEREGFARGANAGSFQQQDEAKLARDALSFRRELDKMPKGMDSHAKENAVVKQYQDLGAMDWLPSREARDLAHDRFNNPDDQLGTLVKAYGLDQRTTPYSGRDIYKRHAGEVEARNVQKRADWDAQRRADVPPAFSQDTVNADQIVRFGEASPFSMSPASTPKEYPVAPRSEWYGHADFEKSGGRMETMTPDEFLKQARPLTIDEVSRENIDILKQHMIDGKTLDPLMLGGKEDGRHRAYAAKELGIAEVPVINFRPKPGR